MIEYFGLEPGESVYIGDNLEKDFKGPNILGIKSIRVIRNGIYKDATCYDEISYPDISIYSLYELADIIANLEKNKELL